MRQFLFFLFFILPAPVVAQDGPSFNCDRAGTPVEFAICDEAYLSSLDRLLGEVYFSLPSQTRDELAQAQRNWIRQRDACQVRPQGGLWRCLVAQYEQQLMVLSAYKEREEGVEPISGTYTLTSEIYRDAADTSFADRWSVKVFAGEGRGAYFIFATATVGATYHTCAFAGRAERRGDDLRIVEVLEQFGPFEDRPRLRRNTTLSMNPRQRSAQFINFDDRPFCDLRAYLQLETEPLVFYRAN